ncbi:MAG TPA: hypothetical protein VLM91_29105, partial [Candidatus Methylomirabilis sp.]|nr:hypothetical protein [Candidatus Methylomirabilis sp.]
PRGGITVAIRGARPVATRGLGSLRRLKYTPPDIRTLESFARPISSVVGPLTSSLSPSTRIVLEDLVAQKVAPEEANGSTDGRSDSSVGCRLTQQVATGCAPTSSDQRAFLTRREARTARSGQCHSLEE